MSESLELKLDDPERFDEILRASLSEGGDLKIITKDNATDGGNAAVMITFSVKLPDGQIVIAQAVTTANIFLGAAKLVEARHGTKPQESRSVRRPIPPAADRPNVGGFYGGRRNSS